MKKPFIVLILLISYNSFFAQEKQKQLYRKPLTFSIGLNTTQFYEGDSGATVESEQGNATLYYSKSEGFSKPAYGLNISIAKTINNHFQAGINIGFSRILNERYSVIENVYFHVIPISLTATYDFWKDKKQLFKPFLTLKGGYTYMNYKETILGDTIKGNLSYGVDFGFYITSKNIKWLKNIHYSIGYANFFTRNHIDSNRAPLFAIYNYKTKREGLTFGVNYNFTQKKKRKKHKKKH